MIDNAPVRLFLFYSLLNSFYTVQVQELTGLFPEKWSEGTPTEMNQHIALWICPDADDHTKMQEKVCGNR